MYNYNYSNDYSNAFETTSLDSILEGSNNAGAWTSIALILALIISLVAYFGFVKTGKKYTEKFVNWLKEFLNFKRIFIENLLKFGYLFLAVYVSLISFGLIGYSFLAFLLVLIVGNLLVRLIFEFSLMMIMIWKNTSEISSDINKVANKENKEVKETKKVEKTEKTEKKEKVN